MDHFGEKQHDVLPAPARCGSRQSLATSANAIAGGLPITGP
jgi:hypothetical protein